MSKSVLLAFAAFKDTMSAIALCDVAEHKLLSLDPSLIITKLALSDGGEGFLHTIQNAFENYSGCSFAKSYLEVLGPLGNPLMAEYGILNKPNETIGVIEMAKASGIEIVPIQQRNPNLTTSHGTGQLILHLYNQNIRKILLGIGGSATVDCGLSVLYALDCLEFELSGAKPRFITGMDLESIQNITILPNANILNDLEITIACDVTNPLLGRHGAAYVFGPQKGLKLEELEIYDEKMRKIANILKEIKGITEIDRFPGSGAAGGIAAGLSSCFEHVKIHRGIDMISDLTNLPSLVENSSVVITGEGKYDSQTAGGKPISKLKEICDKPIIICGINTSDDHDKVYDLVSRFGVEKSMQETRDCLERVLAEVYHNEINRSER